MAERIKIAIAALLAVGGLVAYYALVDQSTALRLAALLGAVGAGLALMAFTQTGRTFVAFSRESWEESKRVVWPSRKETLQTTGVVFLFVFAMAIFMWAVDWGLTRVTQALLGSGG
jgi:preprotein translocase subunit SecE